MSEVLSEGTSRQLGKDAQRNNILAAKVIADIVKSTLGPKGMDKMLVDSSGEIIVTNDGVTILEEMEIEHPAAKMLVEISKTQESEVGDGTTTVALLAGKLLERAEYLLDKGIHPTVIVKGYNMAEERCQSVLREIGIEISDRGVLKKIAMTAMTGKGAEGNREKLSELIVKAVEKIGEGKEVNKENIKIEKLRGASIEDSCLIEGIVLNKAGANSEMPSSVENAKILLADFPLEGKQLDRETRISVTSPEQLESFLESEERYLKELVEKIKVSGANVIFCQKGIDDVAQYYLSREGILAYRRVERSDLEKLARATSGRIISNISDLNEKEFGKAEKVEQVREGDEVLTYVRGCESPKSVSLLLRAGSGHVLDEIERAVRDGLGDVISAVKSGRVVAGGGAVEIELSRRLKAFARTLSGREQLAVDEFANALESIPETLAENAGLDPIDILAELKTRHESGGFRDGLNLFNNKIGDTFELGIIEPIKVKTQAISSAAEVASLILRIDDVLVSGGSLKDRQEGMKDKEDYEID